MPTCAYLCRACGRPFEIQMSIREKEAGDAPPAAAAAAGEMANTDTTNPEG